jgi:hypothetical protein
MRLAEWSHNLDDLIDSLRDKPFAWGKNDCLNFANKAHLAMTGKLLASDWSGDYTTAFGAKRHYLKLLKTQGFTSIEQALDKRLTRIHVKLPPRGSLVGRPADNQVTQIALGVCIGDKVAFISDEGVVFLPTQADDIFWAI